MSRIYSLTINGTEVKDACRSLEGEIELNVLPAKCKATFITSRLSALITPAVGQSAVLDLYYASGLNGVAIRGTVAKIQPVGRLTEITIESVGSDMAMMLEEGADWYAYSSSNDIGWAFRYIIEHNTAYTGSVYPATVGYALTGFSPNKHKKTTLLRRLMQMSKVGTSEPYVFFAHTQASYPVYCSPLGYYTSTANNTLTVGDNIIGRPEWNNGDSDIVNTIVIRYKGGNVTMTDATSIATYGVKHGGVIDAPEISTLADAQQLGVGFLAEWANPRPSVKLKAKWDTYQYAGGNSLAINKKFTINDAAAGKSGVVMTLVKIRYKWPSNCDELTLGSVPFVTADMIGDLDSRVASLENANQGIQVRNVASDTVKLSHDASAATSSTTMAKVKTITVTGGLDAFYRVKVTASCGAPYYTQLFKNGSPIRPRVSSAGFNHDIAIPLSPGDTLEAWAMTSNGSYPVTLTNFRVCYDATTTPTYANG